MGFNGPFIFDVSVHIPSGEKHLVILKEGPGKTMKIVSLSKVTDVTCDAISFTIYDNSCRYLVFSVVLKFNGPVNYGVMSNGQSQDYSVPGILHHY